MLGCDQWEYSICGKDARRLVGENIGICQGIFLIDRLGWFIMSNLLSYKNYNGTVEYSKEDSCLLGKVVGIKSLLSYEGDSVKELEQDFQNVIDEYLADCKERNVEPEQPYKGTFNVRISPELHRNIAVYAIEHGKSLNAAVEEAIGNMVRV